MPQADTPLVQDPYSAFGDFIEQQKALAKSQARLSELSPYYKRLAEFTTPSIQELDERKSIHQSIVKDGLNQAPRVIDQVRSECLLGTFKLEKEGGLFSRSKEHSFGDPQSHRSRDELDNRESARSVR